MTNNFGQFFFVRITYNLNLDLFYAYSYK